MKKCTILRALGTASLLLNVGFVRAQDTRNLSFDSLFPASPFKKTLDMCMQVCGDLDVLSEHRQKSDARTLLEQAVAGKVMQLRVCAESLVAMQGIGRAARLDDIEYLLAIIKGMHDACGDVMRTGADDEHDLSATVRQQLSGIQDDLESLLANG